MKFGGASVKNAEAIRNVARILSNYKDQKVLVVVSAMDKTTNQLEKLANAARDNKENACRKRFKKIRDFHQGMLDELFTDRKQEVQEQVDQFFTEMQRIIDGLLLLQEFPDSTHDRIVSYGELLSSTLLFHYLKEAQPGEASIPVGWLDAREVITTDSTYTRANVIWPTTTARVKEVTEPLLMENQFLLTQGFIARNTEGKATTLGREGSDYTASIFAHLLDAERMVVWKDVPGVLNADPRITEQTIKLDKISYEEAVEMTFYGATVIHPKTIKPLYTKGIPLNVRSFLDVKEEGTWIAKEDETPEQGIMSRIIKKNQAMLHIRPLDFSFMDQRQMGRVFRAMSREGLQVNLVQSSAISLYLLVDDRPTSVREFGKLLENEFWVEVQYNLQLTTLLNYREEDWQETKGALMVQQAENKLFFVSQSF
jgi:aspartate kinase